MIPDDDPNKAKREWALRCAYDERDVELIKRLYPEPESSIGNHAHSWMRSYGWGRGCSYCPMSYESWLIQRVEQLEQDRTELIARVDVLHADINQLQQRVRDGNTNQ